ncbi:U4/U6-U5 snRNP complex subunit [Pichia kluyveri]|uniref:U4/U6-U5 snRNP complex subunit n=1 Tax=Pichia kluyveri TaxID=36015 RepID=A0AAV5QY22_PICKL|nr:U4/U6-U5 snRNP complex subunit [Pichia kluyveri]
MTVAEPLDLLKQNLDEKIFVKLSGYREMVGKLHGYDSHCNIVLGDAVETIYSLTEEEGKLTSEQKNHTLVFIRGDSVILVTDGENL